MPLKSLIVVLLISAKCIGQEKIDVNLKGQLDSILILDQKYRGFMMHFSNPVKKDSIANLFNVPSEQVQGYVWNLQSAIDSSNLIFVENVFKRYGYPGKSLVGSPANEAAWYVIQHSDKIPQYIELIKKAGGDKELPLKLVAMMEDRFLMGQGKEQIYGTQAYCGKVKGGKHECFIWPLKEPEKVNELRKNVGFDLTVEQNAKKMGIEYRVWRMTEI